MSAQRFSVAGTTSTASAVTGLPAARLAGKVDPRPQQLVTVLLSQAVAQQEGASDLCAYAEVSLLEKQ